MDTTSRLPVESIAREGERETTCRRERGGGAKSYDGEKAWWYIIQYSLVYQKGKKDYIVRVISSMGMFNDITPTKLLKLSNGKTFINVKGLGLTYLFLSWM